MLTNALTLFCLVQPTEPAVTIVSNPRMIHASRTEATIHIDGKATEAVWASAEKSGSFAERAPNLGAIPPLPTTISVVYDNTSLYVLVQGRLHAEQPIIRTLRRDSDQIYSDDAITLKIDPFFDRRSAYLFGANLAGAQVDAMSLEDGRVYIPQWDAVWEVESTTDKGWFTMEFRVPFYALGIKNGDSLTMGIDVSRDDPARAAVYDWKLIIPPRSPASPSAFGVLDGLENIDARPVLEITPYALARTNFEPTFSIDPRDTPNLAAGLDLRLQTGPGSYAEASFLTDFSQVDIDEVQVASDRFPLFYPERRPFFINGLDVFNFGYEQEAQLFFSRRIGLNGRVTPIAAGVKAYGRTNVMSYGILNVQTMRVPNESSDDAASQSPRENFSVARFRIQALPQVAVGVLGAARKRMDDTPGDAIEVGFDTEIKTADNRFRSYGFIAGSWRELDRAPSDNADASPPANPAAWATRGGGTASVSAEYRGLYLRPSILWLWSDKQFEAPLGFYRRPGTSLQKASFFVVPRPRFWGIREIEIGPEFSLTTSPDFSSILTMQSGGVARVNWKNNWSVSYAPQWITDDVAQSFTIYNDLEVDAGRYQNQGHEVQISSPSQYMFSASVHHSVGQRFGGPNQNGGVHVNVRAGKHFTFIGAYHHLFGHLKDASDRYNFGYVNGQSVVSIHRDLVWDTLLRVNLLSGDERLDVQSRLRWRYRPGSDIYLVYARNQPLPGNEKLPEAVQSLTLKLNVFLAPRLPSRRRRQRG